MGPTPSAPEGDDRIASPADRMADLNEEREVKVYGLGRCYFAFSQRTGKVVRTRRGVAIPRRSRANPVKDSASPAPTAVREIRYQWWRMYD